MATILFWCVTMQIGAGIPAEREYTVADLQAATGPGSGVPTVSPYTIQPFLKVAGDLQSASETERVKTLRVWAKIRSLEEPVIILVRMLIENSDGTPLRRAYIGAPSLQLPVRMDDFPNEPLVFFQNVPFFAVSGYSSSGPLEPALHYLEHALAVGRWKSHRYGVIDEEELKSIAERFIDSRIHLLPAGGEARLRKWILSQIGPPVPIEGTQSNHRR